MRDLIERQAAIDAGCDGADEWYGGRDEWRDKFITEFIEAVPSAQPEIIRCKDCKHRYVDGENVRFNVCELNHNKVQSDDWYCADAERRDDDKRRSD